MRSARSNERQLRSVCSDRPLWKKCTSHRVHRVLCPPERLRGLLEEDPAVAKQRVQLADSADRLSKAVKLLASV